MRNTLLLMVCLVLGACGMKGGLYEPAPATAGAETAADPESDPATSPDAGQEPDSEPRGDRKTVPATPDPGLSR